MLEIIYFAFLLSNYYNILGHPLSIESKTNGLGSERIFCEDYEKKKEKKRKSASTEGCLESTYFTVSVKKSRVLPES